MRALQYFFFLLLIIAPVINIHSEQPGKNVAQKSSLVVTYRTDGPLDELDRVRFWLINEKHERRLYPKGRAYIDDPNKNLRMVLIENLPHGKYSLEFMIPNSDARYEKIPIRMFTLTNSRVMKIDQEIKKKSKTIADGTVIIEGGDYQNERPEGVITLPKSGKQFYSYPSSKQEQKSAKLQIQSSLKTARWTLYKNMRRIVSGEGSMDNIRLTPGSRYSIEAEPYEGYSIKVLPKSSFTIDEGETKTIELIYQRIEGFVAIEASLQNGEEVSIVLKPSDQSLPPIKENAAAHNGMLSWKSKALPIGQYHLTIKSSEDFQVIDPMKISVRRGQTTLIRPEFIGSKKLTIKTNSADALYTLMKIDRSQSWTGKGEHFTFENLLPGKYLLTFSNTKDSHYISPPPNRITIPKHHTDVKTISAKYEKAAQLTINSNVSRYRMRIQGLGNGRNTIQEEVYDHSKTLFLPPGRYQIVFSNLKSNGIQGAPAPMTLSLKEGKNKDIFAEYPETSSEKKPATELLAVESMMPESTQTTLSSNPKQHLITIEEGFSILGDTFGDNLENALPAKDVYLDRFDIGTYEVTNEQFAAWLNKAYSEDKIVVKSGGNILDHDGNLICKVYNKSPFSQIFFSENAAKNESFNVHPGKANYPVIMVTWYGADMFCKDHGGRLPTEAEWEKAAAMDPDALKKYRYGFGKNIIDRRWANYKDQDYPIHHEQVLTTEVGFYNGTNTLPLRADDTTVVQTQNAKSPFGAYDMSGNVWEWVSDWYSSDINAIKDMNPQGPSTGKQRVAKGGCYDSTADGVRAAERLALPPNHCDMYTGFRIAFSPKKRD